MARAAGSDRAHGGRSFDSRSGEPPARAPGTGRNGSRAAAAARPISSFLRQRVIVISVAKWCTVTVTDPDGRRHSLDVQATSSYDAAHLYVVEAKKERAVGLPKPTLATMFEVVADGKVYCVKGEPSRSGLCSGGRNGMGRGATCSQSGRGWCNGAQTNRGVVGPAPRSCATLF
jgi:hypothetical protein